MGRGGGVPCCLQTCALSANWRRGRTLYAAIVGVTQEAPRGGDSQTLLPALYTVSEEKVSL
jgi:hypothetical protein